MIHVKGLIIKIETHKRWATNEEMNLHQSDIKSRSKKQQTIISSGITYTNFLSISSLSVAGISMFLFSFISMGSHGLIRAPVGFLSRARTIS